MTLLANWRDVLRHAWSVRLWALSIVLFVASEVLPMLPMPSSWPVTENYVLAWPLLLSIAAQISGALGFVLRFFAQKELENDKT